MVLNQELKFTSKEVTIAIVLSLFVCLNVLFTVLSLVGYDSIIFMVCKSAYICLLTWISYPVIAVTFSACILDSFTNEVGGNLEQALTFMAYISVTVSTFLVAILPIIVCNMSTIGPFASLFLYFESLRFNLKTIFYAYRAINRSPDRDFNFVEYMFKFGFV